jgi:preprotein translocase subunit SecF
MKPLRLIPDNTSWRFMGLKKVYFIFSLCLILAAFTLMFVEGLNFGIDFKGGTLIEIKTENELSLDTIRETLNNLAYGNISIQEFGSSRDLLIRVPAQSGGEDGQKELLASVKQSLGEGIDYRRVEYVGPQVGAELIQAGLLAIILSLSGILIYIWFRFEWQYGMAAIIALLHDSLATVGLFALLQLEFGLSTVAAILMIAGYSINDTVVVFDRVRENLRKYKKKALSEVFDLSVNQTLARSVLTSVTTLLALIALYVFGGQVIRDFVIALIFGVAIGTYSSIFLATPLLLKLPSLRTEASQTSND